MRRRRFKYLLSVSIVLQLSVFERKRKICRPAKGPRENPAGRRDHARKQMAYVAGIAATKEASRLRRGRNSPRAPQPWAGYPEAGLSTANNGRTSAPRCSVVSQFEIWV